MSQWADTVKTKMIVRILLLPLKNDSISIFKAEDSLLPVISPASLAKKKKKNPFFSLKYYNCGETVKQGGGLLLFWCITFN